MLSSSKFKSLIGSSHSHYCLHIFMVPMSTAFCMLSVIVTTRSCCRFNFFKFPFKFCGTALIAPIEIMTKSKVYCLYMSCRLVISGGYFSCIPTILHNGFSVCHITMSGLLFSAFVIALIRYCMCVEA